MFTQMWIRKEEYDESEQGSDSVLLVIAVKPRLSEAVSVDHRTFAAALCCQVIAAQPRLSEAVSVDHRTSQRLWCCRSLRFSRAFEGSVG